MVAKLATISDCILEDKRWTEFKKYGKISIRNDVMKLELEDRLWKLESIEKKIFLQ